MCEECWPYGLNIRLQFRTSGLLPDLANDFLCHLETIYVSFSVCETGTKIMPTTANDEGRFSKHTETAQNQEYTQWRKTVEEITRYVYHSSVSVRWSKFHYPAMINQHVILRIRKIRTNICPQWWEVAILLHWLLTYIIFNTFSLENTTVKTFIMHVTLKGISE